MGDSVFDEFNLEVEPTFMYIFTTLLEFITPIMGALAVLANRNLIYAFFLKKKY